MQIQITNVSILYAELVDAIREDVSALTLLAEVLCLLDMIVNSFAHAISTKPADRYTRPEFTGKLLSSGIKTHDFGCSIQDILDTVTFTYR